MAFEEPGSAVPPFLAWTAFFFFGLCAVHAQTDFNLAFLIVAALAGLAAVGWTLWHLFGWHGGMSAAAHRCVMAVAVLVVLAVTPFATRLRSDADELWARQQGQGAKPILSAADLEMRKLRPESLLEFSGRARCEVTQDEHRNPEVNCGRLHWGSDPMPPFTSQPDSLTVALMSLRTLGGPAPDRVKRPRGGWMVDPSRQLPAPRAALDTIVQACGDAEPSPDALPDDGCALIKRAVKLGLWGFAADKSMLDLTSWSGWMGQRDALQEAFLRNGVPWQAALDALVMERETKRLSALASDIRKAQQGGVLLVLTRPPSAHNPLRWPVWQTDMTQVNEAVDKLLAMARPSGLEPFEFRGRFVRRAAVAGETPEYWLDADRLPLTLEQSLHTLALLALAAGLFVLHGLALLVRKLWAAAAAIWRRRRAK